MVQNCTDVHDLIVEHAGQLLLQDATITNKELQLEDGTGSIAQEDGTTDVLSLNGTVILVDEPDSEDITYQNEGLILEDGFKLLREETNEFNIGLEQDTDGVTKLLLENGDDIIIETATFGDASARQ